MGLVAKQSIWNTVLLYIGVAIGYCNVILLFPVVIGAEGYGLIRVILSVVFIVQHFAMFGTPSLLLRYAPKFTANGGKGLFRYGLLVLLGGIALVSFFLFFMEETIVELRREDSALFEDYYFLTIPILIAMSGYTFFANMCRVYLQTVLPIFTYEFLFKLLTTTLLALTWYFQWPLETFLYIWATMYFFNVLVLLGYLLAKRQIDLSWDGVSVDRAFVKESIDFSFFNMMAGASNSIISNIDIVMLGFLLLNDSLALAGIYSIIVFLGNAAMMPTRGLSTIASPLIAKYSEESDKRNLARMYTRTSLNQMVAVGFLFVGLFINLKSLLKLTDISYELGVPVFILIGITRLIQSSTGANGIIINYSRYYRYTTYFIAGLAVVAIAVNYLLIPTMGLTGAALASLISISGFEFLKWAFVWRKLDLQPFTSQHLLALLAGGILLGVNHFIPELPNMYLDIILRSSIISLVALIILMKMDISPDLRKMATETWSRFIKR